ncbi:MAG: MgtC/SapB family protein [Nevskia sp.]|nr:MgtC/SapB family protein [Nevskia sp.]
MHHFDFLLNVLTAVLLGSVIGLERQWRQRLAGLRTNALVALGAAAFVAISDAAGGGAAGIDRTRIAAQIVSGIGFLGGGLILKEGLNVRGLNTAATIWCSAAVGSLAGLGELVPATIAALVVLGTNVVMRPLVYLINRQPLAAGNEVETCYLVEVECKPRVETHIRNSLLQESAGDAVLLRSLRREAVADSGSVRIVAEIVTPGRNDRLLERIASRLSLEQGTSAVTWRVHPHPAQA